MNTDKQNIEMRYALPDKRTRTATFREVTPCVLPGDQKMKMFVVCLPDDGHAESTVHQDQKVKEGSRPGLREKFHAIRKVSQEVLNRIRKESLDKFSKLRRESQERRALSKSGHKNENQGMHGRISLVRKPSN